ncbi:uncharacterized protein LOC126898925 isoform X1 [Daktulosphaira vitifoliae]|uniref:uncharacterized protein LOC126898925 isoform X1 n=1 Tax=Daktulosphaira vitifoliae TaxID=58002 RepID=UPI0021AA7051|nr:uncharacterized protein LOC126898925 isoform X1 [Daktulosphaira vitifoliae]
MYFLYINFVNSFTFEKYFDQINDAKLERQHSENIMKVIGFWGPVTNLLTNLNSSYIAYKTRNSTNSFFNIHIKPKKKLIRYGTSYAANALKRNGTMTKEINQLFTNEKDCQEVSKRSCVCYMNEFLDSIVTRLETIKNSKDVILFKCQSFKPTSKIFFISMSVFDKSTTEESYEYDESVMTKDTASQLQSMNYSSLSSSETEVKFDEVISYRFEKPPDNHFSIIYGIVGNSVKIKCGVFIEGIENSIEKTNFKWDYQKTDFKTNSSIITLDTGQLLISRLDPNDSKNYTCMAKLARKKLHDNIHKHLVLVTDKATYEIHSKAAYKTTSVCSTEFNIPIQRDLPKLIQKNICSLGSSQYACNVTVEPPKCTIDEYTIEVKYKVMLDHNSNLMKQIRSSQKCQAPLYYQKILSIICKVLVANMKKAMTVTLATNTPRNSVSFKPYIDKISMKNVVSCAPGYGLRGVLCTACPEHHYSPSYSNMCIKCPKKFHQLKMGSERCDKCYSIFSKGCTLIDMNPNYFYTVFWIALIFLIWAMLVWCCCRRFKNQNEYKSKGENKVNKKKIKKKKKKKKIYKPLNNSDSEQNNTDNWPEDVVKDIKITPFGYIHSKVGNLINPISDISS